MRKCSRKNNDSITLVKFDVKSLYTSITHNYDLEAVSFWIEEHLDSLHFRFSKGLILESIKLISENNNCTVNDEFYRQTNGATMGTIFASTYATLTMGYCEVHFYIICELKWGKKFQEFILENSTLFLDDYQTPLDKNKVKPQELLETLNSVNEVIQFNIEFSDKVITFLDILIKRDSSGIWMDLYHKPTDTQSVVAQPSKFASSVAG